MGLSSRLSIFLLISVILSPIVTTSAVFADQHSPITLLATHYPPYSIEKPDDGNRGFDVEVAIAAFAIPNIPVKVEFAPWARILRMVELGETAGMISCADTPRRRESSLLSDPISAASAAFMVREGFNSDNLNRIADLKGQDVVAVRGYAYVENFKAEGFSPHLVESDENLLKMLAAKRGNVILVSKENARYLNRKLNLGLKYKFLEIEDMPAADLFICFSKKFPGVERLRESFNAGLAKIRANGTYDAIHAKYR